MSTITNIKIRTLSNNAKLATYKIGSAKCATFIPRAADKAWLVASLGGRENTVIRCWSRDNAENKAWFARITDTDYEYGLDRMFIEPHRDHYGHKGSGSYGREWDSSKLEDGIYQDNEKDLLVVVSGAVRWLDETPAQLAAMIDEMGIDAVTDLFR